MEETIDIAVIGAGLAGVAAGTEFRTRLPHKRTVFFERRQRIGGTWDLFRYPGIRSDSDMYTLGYSFRPWTSEDAIADGADIRDYIEQAARDVGLIDHIRFSMRLIAADWSSERQFWALTFIDEQTGEQTNVRARFIYMATGYYDQDRPYRPGFDGEENFTGEIIHPQHWPDNIDLAGRRVSIIGSGATTVTLAPALAKRSARVTIVQRSPSYVLPVPKTNGAAALAFRLLPRAWAFRLIRSVERRISALFFKFARRHPKATRRYLRRKMVDAVGDVAMVETHFTPDYDPWTQRLCIAADGDLFEAIKDGSVAMETGEIERIETRGIRMKGGDLVESDVIVTATGLRIALFGKADVSVDGKRVKAPRELLYKGAMLSGIPNMIFVFGYAMASWTLKAELVAKYAVRLIEEMERRGARVADPGQPADDIERSPMTDFSSGYFRRSVAIMPRQGDRGPWTLPMDYGLDRKRLLSDPVDDGVLEFR